MRKMVIHFGPDREGGGASKHDLRDTNPAEKRYIEQPEPEDDFSTWLDWLPREIAHRVSRWERVVDTALLGNEMLKRVKGMKRKNKAIAGAVVVAGVAGAAYLASRRRK